MAKIVTYVCDVSGVNGIDEKDFISVKIESNDPAEASYNRTYSVTKLVHRDVAKRLHLLRMTEKDKEVIPEPTLASKFTTLLQEYVAELAYEAGAEAASDHMSNRG